jgi:excisionase family DNA binding protein
MTRSESAAERRRKAADDGPPSLGRPEDDILTTAQVAQLLHVTPKTVIKLVQDGTLTAHRLPRTRQFLFWRNDIVRLIEDSVVKPGDVNADDAERTVTGAE